MDHVAIMKKSWNLTAKILSGEKKIESRWYLTRRKPWDYIKKGEVIYFKNSGESVNLKAIAKKVIQIESLNPSAVSRLINDYGKEIGVGKDFLKTVKDKKYCLLIFLSNPVAIKPFEIDKKGFGNMVAWISVENINKIKK